MAAAKLYFGVSDRSNFIGTVSFHVTVRLEFRLATA